MHDGVVAKFATTILSSFIVIKQAPVPAHAPDHPAKGDPVSGVAAKVTTVPAV